MEGEGKLKSSHPKAAEEVIGVKEAYTEKRKAQLCGQRKFKEITNKILQKIMKS